MTNKTNFSHIGLFEGIGGFSLAAKWMGWKTVAWCEWNPFCQQVLKYHFPEAEGHGDITKTDFTKYANTIDVLSGGFPCQPYSTAGKRKGTEDDRHLWPEMLRAIREIQPRWVVGENVRGLTNWNGGMVFDQVQADLEAQGYEVLPFLLPACAVNAPHRRDRIWFIAYAEGKRLQRFGNPGEFSGAKTNITTVCIDEGTGAQTFINPDIIGQRSRCKQHFTDKQGFDFGGYIESITPNTDGRRQPGKEYGQEKARWTAKDGVPNDWRDFPTQSPLRGRNDGLSSRLAGITFSKHRNESLKAYGNAIVPQVAYEIFKAIEKHEQLQNT